MPKPPHRDIISTKWVFSVKHDENGNPCRNKARLVAKGFTQKYLLDYNETFAPVARMVSFRYLLSMAAQYDLSVHHMDVKTAFLNGDLVEELYIRIPEGLPKQNNMVCKLNKSLYGLKQAARCWFDKFDKVLRDYGFINSRKDNCVYIKIGSSMKDHIFIVLYVDDLVIFTADINKLNELKRYLMNIFQMVDLGEIKLFLGIKITRTKDKIVLDQSHYIKSVINRFNLESAKPYNTPSEVKLNYDELYSPVKTSAPCRNALGCLMYIMLCTRPDICVAVSTISRFINYNNKEVWDNLKRIIRYLKGTIDLKLVYRKEDLTKLDPNYSNILIGFATTVAEYIALYESTLEFRFLKFLGIELRLKFDKPVIIWEDNTGTKTIADNPAHHGRTKHLDPKLHDVRDLVKNNDIAVLDIFTDNQLADILTKNLAGPAFVRLRSQLGLE